MSRNIMNPAIASALAKASPYRDLLRPERAQVGSPLPARRAPVGAAFPGGNGSGCTIPAPAWFQPDAKCGYRCNDAISATGTIVGQAAATSITFDMSTFRVLRFQVERMYVTAVVDNGTPAAPGSIIDWIRISSIDVGTELLPGGEVPAKLFDPLAEAGVFIIKWPELTNGGFDPVVKVLSDAANTVTARVRVTLVGWSERVVA